MENQFTVINPFYTAPHAINLQINTEKGVTYDVKGERIFYVIKDTFCPLHYRRVLYDDKQNPILTTYKKIMALRERCKVFKGESNDPSEFLFSVKDIKKPSKIPRGISKLNVFLANNKDEKNCDFRVIIHGSKRSCIVYAGESPTVVAQMENNGGFNVLVYPNVDYAFIVALLMIVNEMNYKEPRDGTSTSTTANMVATALSLLGTSSS
ncbi:unnamed protein product [Sphenostylis stenocarpa]|uniref:Uncharacterized protein n=1 Tax=Sphenostylis stenocarpa TaxID=92480 RepID=A0AA86RU34_9FABA|nr:unnamed protein product [Sphenostylis stenocarpa]